MTGIRCVWEAGALLGEGPAWCREEGALCWVDIRGCAEAPLSGGLFEIDAGVAGLPEPRFAG